MEQEKKVVSSADNMNTVKEIFEKNNFSVRRIFKNPYKSIFSKKESLFNISMALPPAIDIGTSSIKLVQLAISKKGRLEIICIDQENYPAASRHDSAADLKKSLKKIVERNKIKGNCFITTFIKDVIFYNVVFPSMSELELAAAVKFKITQLKPFGLNIEQILFKFIKLKSIGRQAQHKVLIICVAQETIKRRISLCEETGINPINIEIPSFSVFNLDKFLKNNGLEAVREDEITLWLDLGQEESFLAIEKEGELHFVRSLSLTSKKMTTTIAQHCNIDLEKAEDFKRRYGFIFWSPDKKIQPFFESAENPLEVEDNSKRIYYGLVSLLENLVVDIEHSFKYFSYQVTQSQVTKFDRLILSGGGSNLKNLVQFLTTKLGVPVEQCNPFRLVSFSTAMPEQRNVFINMPANFAVCVGLAIGQRIGDSQRVNLLLPERSNLPGFVLKALKKKSVKIIILFCFCATAILGTQAGKVYYYKSQMNALTAKVNEAKAKLSNLQTTQLKLAKEESEIVNKKSLAEARFRLLKEGIREPEKFSQVLSVIAKLLPDQIWVTKLNYRKGNLIITGSTLDMGLISQLIQDLKTSGYFIDADFNYTQKEPATEIYKFEIAANVSASTGSQPLQEALPFQDEIIPEDE